MIKTKRVYESPAPTDGVRFLVERLWPRGVKKEALQLAGWLKEVAPSPALCQRFGHEPKKWPEFQRRYAKELGANPAAWQPLLETARRARHRTQQRGRVEGVLGCEAATALNAR